MTQSSRSCWRYVSLRLLLDWFGRAHLIPVSPSLQTYCHTHLLFYDDGSCTDRYEFFSDFKSHGLGVFPSSLPADTARGALPHSVSSGARVFVPRNISLLAGNASVSFPAGILSWLGIVGLNRTCGQKLSSGLLLTFTSPLPISVADTERYCLFTLHLCRSMRTWDQKLSSGWMLSVI